ncbi:MAG: putative acyl-CoA dehydrogenase [Bacteroidetes bacterium ADurb.Bin408]|nr:MAG: putative acyl-CoA dehydrogenase [Bacteroidetes bacterium ADurb.Bin408]
MEENKNLKTGEFLVKDLAAENIFIPEEFNEEQLMIADTCRAFIESEVYPILDDIDKGDRSLMKSLVKKAGELGMAGISIPEAYGGFGQSFVTQMLAAEVIGGAYSFSVAFMCHTGIGTLPIMYYGNEEQRQRYVTRLASADLVGAYCLTEPGAGSDANSGKTSATLSPDGKHYILNGQKMWITNGGFCDTQVVFAKIDNDRILSAFIVESNMPGVVIGPDEHKMGIKGSSTTQIYYNDVKVPVENMLGARGEGFRIALSILHMGRMKLGANVIGAAKAAITQSVKYANERKQFGSLISSFGAIKYKLAEMVIRTFAHESAIYRVSNDVDALMQQFKNEMPDAGRAAIEAISHYAVEDAILKVYGSEMLTYCVDEGVQIHGGMGFSAEMKIERGYRDARINRIFEGTNEINRLLVVEASLKNFKKGLFDLEKEVEAIGRHQEVKETSGDYFELKKQQIKNFKNVALILLDSVTRNFKKLVDEQEIQNNLADIITEIYIAESLMLRVKKLSGLKSQEAMVLYKDMLDVYVNDASFKINKCAQDAISSHLESDSAISVSETVSRLTKTPVVNVKEARRRIAAKLIEENKYCF